MTTLQSQSSDVPVTKGVSKGARIGGWIMSIVPALLLLMGGVMNIVRPESVVEETRKMGFPVSAMLPLGIVLTLSTILYLVPRTAVLGAILLVGYLGGAVATHVFRQDPIGQVLFPVIFGALLWGGLWLRDLRVRALVPVSR